MHDEITRAIAGLTARTVARRFTLENERMGKMDRLSEKMAKAAGVVGRISSKIESILDDAEKGLDAVERKLALLSNDPLQASGSSPEVEQKPSATFPGA